MLQKTLAEQRLSIANHPNFQASPPGGVKPIGVGMIGGVGGISPAVGAGFNSHANNNYQAAAYNNTNAQKRTSYSQSQSQSQPSQNNNNNTNNNNHTPIFQPMQPTPTNPYETAGNDNNNNNTNNDFYGGNIDFDFGEFDNNNNNTQKNNNKDKDDSPPPPAAFADNNFNMNNTNHHSTNNNNNTNDVNPFDKQLSASSDEFGWMNPNTNNTQSQTQPPSGLPPPNVPPSFNANHVPPPANNKPASPTV